MNKFISEAPITFKTGAFLIGACTLLCAGVTFGGWKTELEGNIISLQRKDVTVVSDIQRLERKIDGLLMNFGLNPNKYKNKLMETSFLENGY